MCGIFGIIGEFEQKAVLKSLEIMQRRGPDASSIKYFKNGCFAQNRLAIIGQDKENNPPFELEQKYFVFNGELYNYKDFDKTAQSDSQSAFAWFANDKNNFLQSAIGMFAFAMFDESENKLALVRDRFGKKPLYYAYQDNKFIFASSADAIRPHIQTSFNKNALKSYLSYRSVIGSETFYNEIFKLPAGHILEFDGTKFCIAQYYDICEDNENNIADVIADSIQKRLVADCDIGALLSGGIDSSSVCALASNELLKQGKKLSTFCIGYDGFEKNDERYFASLTAKKINSNHVEIVFNKANFLDSLQKCIDAFDEPIADQAALPLNLMCEKINNVGIKVVLSGEGGDEAFLGYEKYKQFYQMQQAKYLPFASYLEGYFKRHEEQNREWDWYKQLFSNEILYKSAAELFTDRQKSSLLNQKMPQLDSEKLLSFVDKKFLQDNDYTKWMSYIDIKIWLGEVLLQKTDKIGMANSLEIRAPFMDYRLLQKCISFGDKRFDNKWLLKELTGKMLPDEVANRAKKGFLSPFNKWLFEFGDPEIVFTLNAKTQFFHKRYLTFLFNNAKKGSFKHQFWLVYIFSKWYISRF